MPLAPVRDAATVVLARDGGEGPEVLLLERHPDSRFAPGAFAFPGGRVEPEDAALAAAARCHGLSPAAAAGTLADVQPPERAIGFWVAALRELFEETGLLLARDGAGVALAGDAATQARLADHRARCRRDPRAFVALLAAEDLMLVTDRMAYCAHWITPEERPIRYDARFFLAAAPPAAAADPDGVEMVGACSRRPTPSPATPRGCWSSRFPPGRRCARSPARPPSMRS